MQDVTNPVSRPLYSLQDVPLLFDSKQYEGRTESHEQQFFVK